MRFDEPKATWELYASHLGDYMRRWIARSPWGTLRIHNILRSDEGRDVHDHPFDFTSIILRGGYIEHRLGCDCLFRGGRTYEIDPSTCREYTPGSIVRLKAEEFHRLELHNGPAWTFVIAGPYRRVWGFQTKNGWIRADEYHRRFNR